MVASVQFLKRGFPDPNFFGNTFIGMNLARRIPNSIAVARPRKEESFEDRLMWQNSARDNLGIDLRYANYMGDLTGRSRELGSDLSDTINLIKEKLDVSNGPVFVHYHFPDTEFLTAEAITHLPEYFGRDVVQIGHLHCSYDFYARNSTGIGKSGDLARRRLDSIKDSLGKNKIKHFVAVTSMVRASYSGLFNTDNISVVENGIDEDVYSFREQRDKDQIRPTIGVEGRTLMSFSGRLDSYKGYDDLLSIMRWFNSREEFDVGFVIASSKGGRYKNFEKDVKKFAPRLAAEGRVGLVLDVSKYTGGMPFNNSKVYSEMLRLDDPNSGLHRGIISTPIQGCTDIYIHPSHFEAFGLSIAEATFSGTPSIAYAVEGVPEVLPDMNGVKIDFKKRASKRVGDFCDAIVDMIEKREGEGTYHSMRERRANRALLLPAFSSTAMGEKMQRKVYSQFT